jgi:hypothetical protein
MFAFLKSNMSSISWVSIVKRQSNRSSSIVDNEEISPMNVIVPEPPAGVMLTPVVTPPVGISVETPANQLVNIEKRRTELMNELKLKADKFYSSYAYSKYMSDIKNLNGEIKVLNEKENKIQNMLILMHGKYSKEIQEYIEKIKQYMGEQVYSKKTYSISKTAKLLNDYINIHIYQGHAEDKTHIIHVDFFAETEDIHGVIDVAIETMMTDFKKFTY